jgi:G3E family GTPase
MTALPRFLVVGGFLGAGKTTALLALASHFHREGLKVGLITNDQAEGLVDTRQVGDRGFRVEEVAGACFCCKFDDLAQAAERLRREERPDVLLGEPVGSCTDLAATVISPLRRLYGDRFKIAPYSVLVDPLRARQMILERGFGGFSSKVAYVFQKQLEEADVIGLGKVDSLAPAERDALLAALAANYPRARVVAISGLTGEGISEWLAALDEVAAPGRNVLDLDYDLYAEGEAELGWLNLDAFVTSDTSFDPDASLLALLDAMRGAFERRGHEVAHLKLAIEADGAIAVGNAVRAGGAPRVASSIGREVANARLVVNARVHADPDSIHEVVVAALAAEETRLTSRGTRFRIGNDAHFRPGRPVPTHRDAAPG